MAKYDVTRSCGHNEVVNLIGPGKNREWRLNSVEPHRLCRECWEVEKVRKQAEDNAKASELAKEWELPELQGTEKQIAWAETIRTGLIEALEDSVAKSLPRYKTTPESLEQLQEVLDLIKSKSSAHWWIERRYAKDSIAGLSDLLRSEINLLSKVKTDAPEGKRVEAIAEATVRPEKPVTETVAEIRTTENSIEIVFPEKRDEFREIVKQQMGMEWSGGCWKRELGDRNGSPQDRAAEAGHRLLAAGFLIRTFDPEIREKAINGTYELECTRWVLARTKGDYIGWLIINWARDDDFYKAAKRLPGARWSKPSMAVPPESYDEVLDFAKMYGFQITALAQEIITTARQIKENALVAKVDPPVEKEGVTASGMPPVLEVPEHVDIADEFKD